MDLTEVKALNKELDQSMDQSIQEIINSIDSQHEIFQNVNMEEYMQVFGRSYIPAVQNLY